MTAPAELDYAAPLDADAAEEAAVWRAAWWAGMIWAAAWALHVLDELQWLATRDVGSWSGWTWDDRTTEVYMDAPHLFAVALAVVLLVGRRRWAWWVAVAAIIALGARETIPVIRQFGGVGQATVSRLFRTCSDGSGVILFAVCTHRPPQPTARRLIGATGILLLVLGPGEYLWELADVLSGGNLHTVATHPTWINYHVWVASWIAAAVVLLVVARRRPERRGLILAAASVAIVFHVGGDVVLVAIGQWPPAMWGFSNCGRELLKITPALALFAWRPPVSAADVDAAPPAV